MCLPEPFCKNNVMLLIISDSCLSVIPARLNPTFFSVKENMLKERLVKINEVKNHYKTRTCQEMETTQELANGLNLTVALTMVA